MSFFVDALNRISLDSLKHLAVGLFVFASTAVVLTSILVREIYNALIKCERKKQKLLRERAKTRRLQLSTIDILRGTSKTKESIVATTMTTTATDPQNKDLLEAS